MNVPAENPGTAPADAARPIVRDLMAEVEDLRHQVKQAEADAEVYRKRAVRTGQKRRKDAAALARVRAALDHLDAVGDPDTVRTIREALTKETT